MDDVATRAKLIAAARSLLLRDGDKFTVTSLCKESGLCRTKLRRTFPRKATLISAVLSELLAESGGRQGGLAPTITSDHDKSGDDGLCTSPAPTCNDSDGGVNDTTSQPTLMYIDDEWIERRFRVVERAVDALEKRIETCCGEQSNSIGEVKRTVDELERRIETRGGEQSNTIALLEQKLASAMDSTIVPATIVEPPPFIGEPEQERNQQECSIGEDSINNAEIEPKISVSVNPAARSSADALLKHSPTRAKMSAFFENARGSANEALPPERHILENTQLRFIALTAAVFVILLMIAGLFWPDNHARAKDAPAATANQHVQELSSVALIDATGIPKARYNEDPIGVRGLMAQAKSGNAQAQAALAEAFLQGAAEERNPLAAVRWSQVAAEQGEPSAQFILGTLYSDGIEPNPRRAVQWFFAAASQGNVKAMHNLGIAFLNGQGITKDSVTAADWFSRAAHLGYRDSEFDLAVLYERGEGVAQSPQDALRWYDKASSAGDQEAAQRAAFLRSTLSYVAEKRPHPAS